MRKIALVSGEYYHIFNRSIAGFRIFNNDEDYHRLIRLLQYYQSGIQRPRYSQFRRMNVKSQQETINIISALPKIVDIICYCLMPTHFHLLLKQNLDNGITKYLGLIENSYSRYFNIRHKRKGPLWESRFSSIHIDTNEQLLHLTRYIHLNPSSAELIKKPENWEYSSYSEYISINKSKSICEFRDIIDMSPKEYRKFVYNRKDYQRQISIIKSQLIDDYAG